MSERFNLSGIPSVAVSADTPRQERQQALRDLRNGTINAVFAVDLFNEGVDVPEIDTVLFLRPTESATVFLQQLGRGLRLADDKPCLTVLDFIGAQTSYSASINDIGLLPVQARRGIERDVEQGFPYLPAGCHIELDRVASGIVLPPGNIRHALRVPWQGAGCGASSARRRLTRRHSSQRRDSSLRTSTVAGTSGGSSCSEEPDSLTMSPSPRMHSWAAPFDGCYISTTEEAAFLRTTMGSPSPSSVRDAFQT